MCRCVDWRRAKVLIRTTEEVSNFVRSGANEERRPSHSLCRKLPPFMNHLKSPSTLIVRV